MPLARPTAGRTPSGRASSAMCTATSRSRRRRGRLNSATPAAPSGSTSVHCTPLPPLTGDRSDPFHVVRQVNAFDVSYPDPRMADQPIHHYDIDFIIPPRNPGEPGKQKKMNRIQAWELWQELGPSNPDIAGIFETAVRATLRLRLEPRLARADPRRLPPCSDRPSTASRTGATGVEAPLSAASC
jgi:hypothetical protein